MGNWVNSVKLSYLCSLLSFHLYCMLNYDKTLTTWTLKEQVILSSWIFVHKIFLLSKVFFHNKKNIYIFSLYIQYDFIKKAAKK